MKKTKVIITFIAIFIIIISIYGYFRLNNKFYSSDKEIDSFLKNLNIGQLKEQNLDNIFLKGIILKKTENESKSYIDRKITMIKSIYGEYNVPYPGPLTNKFECDQKYMPKEVTFDNLKKVVETYANDRKIIGICDLDQITYKKIHFFFYCPKQSKLLELEIFFKDLNYNSSQIFSEISC